MQAKIHWELKDSYTSSLGWHYSVLSHAGIRRHTQRQCGLVAWHTQAYAGIRRHRLRHTQAEAEWAGCLALLEGLALCRHRLAGES